MYYLIYRKVWPVFELSLLIIEGGITLYATPILLESTKTQILMPLKLLPFTHLEPRR